MSGYGQIYQTEEGRDSSPPDDRTRPPTRSTPVSIVDGPVDDRSGLLPGKCPRGTILPIHGQGCDDHRDGGHTTRAGRVAGALRSVAV